MLTHIVGCKCSLQDNVTVKLSESDRWWNCKYHIVPLPSRRALNETGRCRIISIALRMTHKNKKNKPQFIPFGHCSGDKARKGRFWHETEAWALFIQSIKSLLVLLAWEKVTKFSGQAVSHRIWPWQLIKKKRKENAFKERRANQSFKHFHDSARFLLLLRRVGFVSTSTFRAQSVKKKRGTDQKRYQPMSFDMCCYLKLLQGAK